METWHNACENTDNWEIDSEYNTELVSNGASIYPATTDLDPDDTNRAYLDILQGIGVYGDFELSIDLTIPDFDDSDGAYQSFDIYVGLSDEFEDDDIIDLYFSQGWVGAPTLEIYGLSEERDISLPHTVVWKIKRVDDQVYMYFDEELVYQGTDPSGFAIMDLYISWYVGCGDSAVEWNGPRINDIYAEWDGIPNVATLSDVTFDEFDIDQWFSSNKYEYTATTGSELCHITATTADPSATLKINGNTAVSGAAFPIGLDIGENIITVQVTAQDGITNKTYIFTIENGTTAELSSISFDGIKLNKNFSRPVYDGYFGYVFNALYCTITPTTPFPGDTITANGIVCESGKKTNIPLDAGANPVEIVVTALDGVTTAAYIFDIRNLMVDTNMPSLTTFIWPQELRDSVRMNSSENGVYVDPLLLTSGKRHYVVHGIYGPQLQEELRTDETECWLSADITVPEMTLPEGVTLDVYPGVWFYKASGSTTSSGGSLRVTSAEAFIWLENIKIKVPIQLPFAGQLKLIYSCRNIYFYVNDIYCGNNYISESHGEIIGFHDPWVEIRCDTNVLADQFVFEPGIILHGIHVSDNFKGPVVQYPLQTGKDYVYALPGEEGTMFFNGMWYKFVDFLERFPKVQHLAPGESADYEYGGHEVVYNDQPYQFLASGITDPSGPGGFGSYNTDTKKTVVSLADRESFVNFYYTYPMLAQVAKPVWVNKIITWKDVPKANFYKVTLYNENQEALDTKIVAKGIQRFDYTDFIENYLPAGSYTCTVQAWEVNPYEV